MLKQNKQTRGRSSNRTNEHANSVTHIRSNSTSGGSVGGGWGRLEEKNEGEDDAEKGAADEWP
ncbi:phospholipid-translocating P-type ATPase [Sesbania bispinosa]|nr:phospholipid-translocating P-type ATPase [Sesbania bispinosa]